MQDVESFSDHQYIEILLWNPVKDKKIVSSKLRWNFRKLDDELFLQVLEFLANSEAPDECGTDPAKYAAWISEIMRSACNVAAPIIKTRNNRRQVYWWSDSIAELRRTSIRCRRAWFKSKRDINSPNILVTREAYAAAKKALRTAIKKAKNNAWKELISTIEKDSWGLPYKLVTGKLRKTGPSLSETLDADALNKLLDSLFPRNITASEALRWSPGVQDEGMDVSMAEIIRLVKKRPSSNAAPGPDNVKAMAWKRAPNILMAHIAALYTGCLKEGVFHAS